MFIVKHRNGYKSPTMRRDVRVHGAQGPRTVSKTKAATAATLFRNRQVEKDTKRQKAVRARALWKNLALCVAPFCVVRQRTPQKWKRELAGRRSPAAQQCMTKHLHRAEKKKQKGKTTKREGDFIGQRVRLFENNLRKLKDKRNFLGKRTFRNL